MTTMSVASPGALLAEKRQAYGWSIKDVADAMRLSQRQVVAIEEGDYASLPSKTYIMGYWRSYAQLLKISIDDSIQIHRANLSPVVKQVISSQSHRQVRGNEEKSRKRDAGFFACLLAVFLLGIWYWQDPSANLSHWVDEGMTTLSRIGDSSVDQEQAPALEDTDLSSMIGPVSELPEESILAVPEPNFSEGQQSVEINTRGYEVEIVELPLSRPNLTYQLAQDDIAEPTLEPGQTATQPEPAVVQPIPQPAPQPEVTAAVTSQPSSPSRNQIVFKVEKESWVDVRDSRGERLIYRTVNRGEDIRLQGNPPYSVFIGSADGVAVEYQGARVLYEVHESGLFARFEVGNP